MVLSDGGGLSTFGLVWVGGMLPAAVLCAAALEWERRTSPHWDVKMHRRLPAVAGTVGGVIWPVVVAVLSAVFAVWMVGRSGRTVLGLLGVD